MVIVRAKTSVCPSVGSGHRAHGELCFVVPKSVLDMVGSSLLEQKEFACPSLQTTEEGHILSQGYFRSWMNPEVGRVIQTCGGSRDGTYSALSYVNSSIHCFPFPMTMYHSLESCSLCFLNLWLSQIEPLSFGTKD